MYDYSVRFASTSQHGHTPERAPSSTSQTSVGSGRTRLACVDQEALYVSKPTGLSREELWRLLFIAKHRANPWQEQEFRGANWRDVWAAWERAQYDMGIYKANTPPFCIDVAAAMQGLGIENHAARRVLH